MSNPLCHKLRMDKNTLETVGEWAHAKVASGEEPPWTQPKFKQLAGLIDEIIASMNATVGIDVGAPKKDICEIVDDDTGANGKVVQLDRFRPVKVSPEFLLPA